MHPRGKNGTDIILLTGFDCKHVRSWKSHPKARAKRLPWLAASSVDFALKVRPPRILPLWAMAFENKPLDPGANR